MFLSQKTEVLVLNCISYLEMMRFVKFQKAASFTQVNQFFMML